MKMSSWYFFCRSKAPAWSLLAQRWVGEGAPSLFPVPAVRGQGLPHPQLRKWHRPPTSHSEETPGRPQGEAAKQRAPEPPFLPLLASKGQHEDLAHLQKRHCHKMARIACCGVAFPWAWVAHNILGESHEKGKYLFFRLFMLKYCGLFYTDLISEVTYEGSEVGHCWWCGRRWFSRS